MAIYLTIGFLATALLLAWIVLSYRRPAAKALLISFFEWFGELGTFFGRLVRAAFVPPYEGRELIRQMDAVGSHNRCRWSRWREPQPEWSCL